MRFTKTCSSSAPVRRVFTADLVGLVTKLIILVITITAKVKSAAKRRESGCGALAYGYSEERKRNDETITLGPIRRAVNMHNLASKRIQ